MRTFFQARFFTEHLLPSLLCLGLAFALSFTSFVQRIEFRALDYLVRLRSHYQAPPDPRLVTVGIDDESLKVVGRWPWSRTRHGQFMYAVSHAEPAVVTWDILFTEPAAKAADEAFAQEDIDIAAGASTLKGRAIFGAVSQDDPGSTPVEGDMTQPLPAAVGDPSRLPNHAYALFPITPLRSEGLSAFVDTPAEDDGIRRYVPMLQLIGDQLYPSLSLQTVITFWQLTPPQVRIVLGEAIYLDTPERTRRIPIDDQGRYLINYRFGPDTSRVLSYYHDVYNRFAQHYLEDKPQVNVPDIKGKILLIGQYATGLSDNGVTPFVGETPLVLVHANVIENILREDYIRRGYDWAVFLLMIGLGVTGLWLYPKRRLSQQTVFGLCVITAYLMLATQLWISASVWLPLLWPPLGFFSLQILMIARQLLREQRDKKKLKGMFETYLAPELVARMIESGQAPQLGGHREDITAYFSDIQNFSTFSELIPPDALVELMNEYLTACTDLILAEGGSLDKYIGDAVVAMFGAPLPVPDHAYRACVTSQRIQERLRQLREKWKAEGDKWPSIVWQMQSRIGLNSGEVIVGNMGSRTRFNYTMMGDNVNLAARMESGCKNWGVYTMCTEATKLACERDGGDRVIFRPLGRVVVKGRRGSVPIFEIVGLRETITAETRECLQLFAEGIRCFQGRRWQEAIAHFQHSMILEPNQPGVTPGVINNPSLVYILICRHYENDPPPPEWNGDYVMKEK